MIPLRKLWGILCVLIFMTQSKAQVTDLKRALDTLDTDTSKVKILAKLGFNYAFIDLDSSRLYSNEAIRLARELGFEKGEARGLNNLAISYDIEADYEHSIQYFLEALSHYNRLGDKSGMASVYSNCGMAYQNMQDLDRSLDFHQRSLMLETELQDSIGMAYSMLHIAGVQLQKDALRAARKNYVAAEAIFDKMELPEEKRFVHIGMGELLLRSEKPKQALSELTKALPFFESVEDKRGTAQILLLIAEAYEKDNKPIDAEQNYLAALKLAEDLQANHIALECYKKLSAIYESWEKFAESLAYYKKYKSQEGSIVTEGKTAKLNELENAYELGRREQEILLLNKEQEFSRKVRNIMVVTLIAAIILLLFVFRLYKLKQVAFGTLEKQQKLIERKNFIIQVEKQNALQASEAKAQFLSNMSHEIRTPLNAIIGLAHLIEDQNFNKEQKDNLQGLVFSAQSLLSLVNDILDFSKIEAGKIEFNDVPFSPTELTSNVRHLFKGAIKEKDLKMRVKLDDQIPDMVIGDPSKLSQILTNLVNNAVKFTEQGVITLDLNLISQTDDRVVLEFSVEDTGIGIPVSQQKEVFKTFSQADSRISDTYGGTGLGLAIVKKLLQQKGSEIYLDSQVGRGSRFYFQMTFKVTSKAHYISTKAEKASFKSLKGLRVLLVEDNKINEMLGVKLLGKWKITVDVAQNGLQAVEMVQMRKYDLILMDIQMPEMDGYEAALTIRKMDGEAYQHVPIVALTAAATTDAMNEILESGMNDYIYKPYNPNDLYLKIEQYAILGSTTAKEEIQIPPKSKSV